MMLALLEELLCKKSNLQNTPHKGNLERDIWIYQFILGENFARVTSIFMR